ncbi:type I-B CRISPR-associated endonuclease Cas1b [Cetobacterium somerae]|uniref:type I-B CRISPR-associated endonuclease Cas1b n=1 Tax=Cetobacterium sp. NK01 TaxID=2993530 RepID=UPI0021169EDC|nr:type I-B CRISPR-associated endonuclease Cas1b [Cetobacterium sp. NK01]MCQ8213455.1 type I-B CRISPR-associated endonuclease Cas1b [Cetobacterium sp. NK01]
MGTKYILSKGELHRQDNSLNFKNSNGNNYIPIEGIDEIYCLDEVSFNTKVIDFLSKNNIILHLFNHYEGYSGTFYPREKYMSGKAVIKQVEAFNEKRELIAKAIVLGIANNIHEVLYHYYRHGKEELKEFLDWLKDEMPKKLENSNDISEILLTEADIWYRFYNSFSVFLREDFVFNKRVKRPPDNPLNALISFGNTILYTKTMGQIYQTHLDQRISFLHSPQERRFSLSLDLSEVFKPVIVFKTIFDCVNNRKLSVEKHFDKNLNYCLLNESGKKIFLEALESKFNETFKHTTLLRNVSYLKAIKYDGYKLLKYILEDFEFNPFSLKEKK